MFNTSMLYTYTYSRKKAASYTCHRLTLIPRFTKKRQVPRRRGAGFIIESYRMAPGSKRSWWCQRWSDSR